MKLKPSKWHELGPFTVFDLETTGLSATRDRIVEIAAIRIETDGKQKKFHSLINPQCEIPLSVSEIHNITDEMVAAAPLFSVIGKDFLDFAKDSTLVAHNAYFDLSFLQESLFREGFDIWGGKTMDSITIIKHAYPGFPSYSLQNLLTIFGKHKKEPAHRAFADVEWTLEIFGMAMQVLLQKSAIA